MAVHFVWPPSVVRYLMLALAVGFCVVLVLAWYHGDRGEQRVSGAELLIVGLLLAIGGAVVGYVGPQVMQRRAEVAVRGAPAAAARAIPVVANGAQPLPSVATAAPVPAKSIAVLPFENLASDKENAYFVSGMQDLILTRLADIGDLKVISRTSTMKYKSHPDNLRKVAAELGVATVVEGSVQKQGKQVLINVQLIDAKTDTHLWAEIYTRTLDNVFGVEGEVAGKIAEALHAKLSPALSARLATMPTTNSQAYDLMMRSDYQVGQDAINGIPHDWNSSIALHTQAIALDPNFAEAWARRSMAEEHVGKFEQARKDAEHAVALRPDLGIVHRALGHSYRHAHNDTAALKEYAKGLELSPNDGYTLAAQGSIQLRQGHLDAAIATFERAAVLNPDDFNMLLNVAGVYKQLGRWAEAETWYKRALTLAPGSARAAYEYARIIVLAHGDVAQALTLVRGDAPRSKYERAELLTYQRKFHDAIALLEGVPDSRTYFGPGALKVQQLAIIHRLAGDVAQARSLFAKALPLDRAELAKAQGIDQANLLGVVGMDELGVGHVAQGLAAIATSEAILDKTPGSGGGLHIANARAYVMAGRTELATASLAKALAGRAISWYSPVLLWIDPWWDPIRTDPRFVALLAKYAKYKPSTATAPASS